MPQDLRQQDDASAIAYGWAQRTWAVRDDKAGRPVAAKAGQFSSWLQGLGDNVAVTSDGIGTKIELAERLGRYDTLGLDLVAMVVDDLAANGAEPVALTNTLDVDVVDSRTIDRLMQGLHDAAWHAGTAVVGGEIAELGSRIGGWGAGMHFNWCATAVGLFRRGWQPVDGSAVRPGDAVVALQSTSFRSNGFSALRRALGARHGDGWHEVALDDRTWGQWLLDPCRIYCPLVVALRETGFNLHGLSHITGGGIPSKFGRTLKASGLGASLDDLWAPTLAMTSAQALAGFDGAAAWQYWNMGNGFLVTVGAADAEAVAAFANERGFAARVAGRITPAPGIELKLPNETLRFEVG